MTVSINTSGTQTATLSTQHVLATISTPGEYILTVNVKNLADGEDLELKAYVAVDTGDSRELAYVGHAKDKRGDGVADTGIGITVMKSQPIDSPVSVRFTLEQNGGVGRAFDWSVSEL